MTAVASVTVVTIIVEVFNAVVITVTIAIIIITVTVTISCLRHFCRSIVIFIAIARAVKYDLETAMLKDNGVFWVDFASIFQYFKNVFMNWNPRVFSFRLIWTPWP